MNGGVAHALDQALAFWRAPALLASARHRPLPDDVLEVVRIAAGDNNATGQGAEATGTDPGQLTEAAAFYLQQLLFAPGTDSYRVLGVNPGADDARIKEHYRWLVRWLHPDRNPDEWEALYADRVNRAWQDLRTPAKRAAYDATRDAAEEWDAPVGGTSVPNASPTTPFPRAPIGTEVPPTNGSEPLLSARTARRLPYIVLGGFGAIAGALLTLMWYAQDLQPMRALPPTAPAAGHLVPAAVDQISVAESEPQLAAAAEPPVAPVGGTSVPIAPQPIAESAPEPPAKLAAVESPPASVTSPLVGSAPTRRQGPLRQAEIAPAAAAPIATHAPALAEVETNPAPAPAPALPTPIAESQATRVLAAYTTAYTTGDLASLMQLFTQDARGPGGGRDSIAADYRSLFDNTRKRQMVLQRRGWLAGPERATVLARFEARLVPAGGLLTRTTEGEIRFDLGWEDGKLRIRGISHVED